MPAPLIATAKQSAGFTPYGIYDFATGESPARQPWLSPRDGWRKLEDCHLFRGRIEKRRGYEKFGTLGHLQPTETLGGPGPTYSGTVANPPVKMHEAGINDGYFWIFQDSSGTPQIVRGYLFLDASSVVKSVWMQEIVGESIGPSGSKNYTGTLASAPFPLLGTFPETDGIITFTDGTQTIIDRGLLNGTATDFRVDIGDVDISGTNTVNRITGAYDITFAATTTGAVTVTYWHYVGNAVGDPVTGGYNFTFDNAITAPVTTVYEKDVKLPVMGIKSFFTRAGNEYLIVQDTKRIFLWNEVQGRFNDVSITAASSPDAVDIWTGDDKQFFRYEVFEDQLIIVNNKDPVHVFEPEGSPPPYVRELPTDWDATGGNNMDTASLVLRHKNRLIYFNVIDDLDGRVGQRARWTPQLDIDYSGGSATTQYDQDFRDAPTPGEIVAAEENGEDIIVAFQNPAHLRRLVYTGDSEPGQAYEWERVPSADGCISRMSPVVFSEEVLMRGQNGLITTDGLGEKPLDLMIPDETIDNWHQGAAFTPYTFGMFIDERRQVLWTYVRPNGTVPDRARVMQFDDTNEGERSWSVYKIPMHSFGRYRKSGGVNWDDITDDWNDFVGTWDDPRTKAGFPQILSGDRNGVVYTFGEAKTDDGVAITAVMRTNKLNPYPFRRPHLGWIDIFCTASSEVTVTIDIFGDWEQGRYFSRTISIVPSNVNLLSEKVKRRVAINRIMNWHEIQITATGEGEWALDAVEPYFRDAGPMRQVA